MEEHQTIREAVVAGVLKHPSKYELGKSKRDLKRIETMRQVGVMPDWCLLEAFVKEFKTDVFVHEDGVGVVGCASNGSNGNNPAIHLQSLRGCHFNLILPDGEDADELIIRHIDLMRARASEPLRKE
jgi:hypothetical protein